MQKVTRNLKSVIVAAAALACGTAAATEIKLQRVNTGTFVTGGLVKGDETAKLISYGVEWRIHIL